MDPLALRDAVRADASAPVVDTALIAPMADAADSYGGRMLRIGPSDQLAIAVLEAPELDRAVRVDGAGRISLPLVGELVAAGLTPRELEVRIQTALKERYIRDPHVSVQVSEMQSRAVSVVGAVEEPGVFQIREPRPLLELIALAGGFTPDAGEQVIVIRAHAAPLDGTRPGSVAMTNGGDGDASSAPTMALTVNRRALLESGRLHDDVVVHPGDQIKVVRAGLAYVVGQVRSPGAFPVTGGSDLTVLRAIALAEGFEANAAKGRTLLIRVGPDGERQQIAIDLGDVLAGRAEDVRLQPEDVVFVPNDRVRTVAAGVVDALVRMVTLRGVF